MQPSVPESLSAGQYQSSNIRRYDLDWLRVIAIITLLFYHTGMIYVSWGWHIKSAEHSQPMEEVMRWLHRWRMPLLFFISGAGTYFALQRRTHKTYAGERFRRLFVPLVFGMFVVVPPQIYIEWLFRNWFTGSYLDFYPEVFKFQPYREGVKSGAFSWHHLWFVLYLFLYSLISIPVFRWLQNERGQRFMDQLESLLTRQKGSAFWIGTILIFASQLALKPFFQNETHALIDDWAYFVKNLLLFWFGYFLTSRRTFWQLLTDQRRIFLWATAVCTLLLYGVRAVYDFEGPDILAVEIFAVFYLDCLTWASVLMTVAYGYRYLNHNRPILPYLTEAVYPFYILHQTVIVAIGYWILQTSLGVYDGFLVVSFASGLISMAMYWFLIRPFRLMRLFFGVK